MGARKRIAAEKRKEARKSIAQSRLNNVPSSPRKMRLVADLVREMNIDRALAVLQYTNKAVSPLLYKLLSSAIANWTLKNPDADIEAANLFIASIQVNEGRMLKRLRPAPQGRGYRIRKRSNHVSIVLGSRNLAN